MRGLKSIPDLVERAHLRLAVVCRRVLSRLWGLVRRLPLGARLALVLSLIGAIAAFAAWQTGGAYVAARSLDESLVHELERSGHLAGGVRLAQALLCAGGLAWLAAAFTWCRRAFALRLMQAAWAAAAATCLTAFAWMVRMGSLLFAADYRLYSAETRNEAWYGLLFWSVLFVLPVFLAGLFALGSRAVRAAYRVAGAPWGGWWSDRALETLKTGGKDPRWRSSWYYTIAVFLACIFLPYLAFIWGWEEPYGLPKGGGQQVFETVKVKKIKKKKPKKLTVNPWSPYILERMNIDDVVTLKELEEETRDTYAAQNAAQKGGKGEGKGGWPNGMNDSAIRFIRLKYRGGDWDQDMGKGADYNLLLKFREWTGMNIAKDTEFREISRLKLFPKKRSPPFVFMTGMGGISISDAEAKILRDYCLVEGGMLFIDNGGGHFDSSVRAFLRKVFPGKSLVDVPNDDLIHQRPYLFPDGAPAFWHHAGYRASGIREDGRWIVYYHPGDINDAWRDDHSGASPEVADQAYKLGVNVMFYAFNQYYKRHYE